jgi:thioesterase domain-containing protein
LLGGFSFGGLVAYEMARQLEQQGREVACLALFDTSSRRNIPHPTLSQRVRLHMQNLLNRNLSERWDYARERARAAKKRLSKRLWSASYARYRDNSQSLPKALRNIRLINDQASREYVLRPFKGRVSLFRASDDADLRQDLLLGWDELAEGVDLYRVPGNHLSVIKEPHVAILAEELAKCLRSATSSVNFIDQRVEQKASGSFEMTSVSDSTSLCQNVLSTVA